MKKIILFTNMTSIKKHWQDALYGKYLTFSVDKCSLLEEYLTSNSDEIIIMLDELSTPNILESLKTLRAYPHAKVLLFNAVPEVHHASTLLKEGIKGYENSYIHKENLLTMLKGIEGGNRWLFSDLTHFIINQYIQTIDKSEPDFLQLLTQKEKDIAFMISDGLSNKEIAQQNKIALSTVKGHIGHIFEKAGVTDRISLALKFK